MTISIDPRVFGSPLVTWTAFAAAVVIVAGMALLVARAPGIGVRPTDAYAAAARGLPWGVLGARVLHVLDHAGYYAVAPFQVLYVWNGGFAAWGALLGGSAGALWYAHRRGMPVAKLADALVLPGLMGIALFRFVDFLTGQRPGAATSLPWGVVYAHRTSDAYMPGAAQHPVALYEMALVLVFLAVFWVLRRARPEWPRPEGFTYLAGLAAYAAVRLLAGFARVDPEYLGLQQAQWIALAVLIGMAVWAARRRIRNAGRALRQPEAVADSREERPVA